MRFLLDILLRSTFTVSIVVAALSATRTAEATGGTGCAIGSCKGYPACSGTCAKGSGYAGCSCKNSAILEECGC